MTIQEMLKALRVDMSQSAIAEKVGTSDMQISRCERGQIPNYELGKRIEALYQDRIQVGADSA